MNSDGTALGGASPWQVHQPKQPLIIQERRRQMETESPWQHNKASKANGQFYHIE